MTTKHYNRPSTSYSGEAGLANRTKYQTDSSSTPKVPISSSKVDGDFNYILDALNSIFDSITAGSVLDGSISTVKLADGAVTLAKMAAFTGLSVMGTPGSSSATPTAITASSDGTVLVRDGTSIGFGQVATAGIGDAQVNFAKMQNISSPRLVGRGSVGSGQIEQVTLGQGVALDSSAVLTAGGLFNNAQVFTAGTSSFTPAAGVTRVYVEVWGSGGGGGNAGTTNCMGAGGGAGAYSAGFVTVTPATAHAVVVAAGGAAATNGGASSFAGASVTLTANGGVAGASATASDTVYVGGAGGTASGGTVNLTGQQGTAVRVISGSGSVNCGNGGSAPRGGVGGVGAFALNTNINGFPGQIPGGAGGGATRQGGASSASGGAGADGMVIVYYPQ